MDCMKSYRYTKFSVEAIQEAFALQDSLLKKSEELQSRSRTVCIGDERWSLDSTQEFFQLYSKDGVEYAYIDRGVFAGGLGITVEYSDYTEPVTSVTVEANDRAAIATLFNVFDNWALKCTTPIPLPPATPIAKPTVFIGHGRSPQWRDLKDHLAEKHQWDVVAYETGARAGHTIRDILESMVAQSSIAFLVMTAEDELADGTMAARPNVIHEAGLFQGSLGFNRAIVLLEDGASEFSNLQGLQQIRYSKNNIKETFGEALATLRREFVELFP